MKIPGFSAEASLDGTNEWYQGSYELSDTGDGVRLAADTVFNPNRRIPGLALRPNCLKYGCVSWGQDRYGISRCVLYGWIPSFC